MMKNCQIILLAVCISFVVHQVTSEIVCGDQPRKGAKQSLAEYVSNVISYLRYCGKQRYGRSWDGAIKQVGYPSVMDKEFEEGPEKFLANFFARYQ